MAETMSHVERVLWRIAELGARCSQQAASGARGPLWAELEHTIAGLEAEFEAASQAGDTAQVRTLESRLKMARQERDRERMRGQESVADAEAARRERDRAIQKAKKAMAITIEAKNAAAEAKATATECVAKAVAAEAAADQALAARDQAMTALDEAISSGERAADARDEAVRDLDETRRALDDARARVTELEAAVVVLPGVALPEPPAGPVAPASRVSWQPTWSEWARSDDPAMVDETDAAPVPDVVDVADTADELMLDEPEEGGVRRYLNVAATIGQLLPEDLGPLLLAGTTVVRREGRLFATVAITTSPWAEPGSDVEQVARFADAGLKVEWTSDAPLGV